MSRVVSFGYLHGLPPEAAITFDVRETLSDPARLGRHLLDSDGRNPEVQAVVWATPRARRVLELAVEHGRTFPEGVIAIGCAGGRHRSVAIAEAIADALGWEVEHRHVGIPRVLKSTEVVPDTARRKTLLAAARDAGADFAYYDRKEDENLSREDVEEALRAGEVTPAELAGAFLGQVVPNDVAVTVGAEVLRAAVTLNESQERDELPDDAPLLDRAAAAVDLIARYGGFDGGRHKMWVMDQVVRRLLGSSYPEFVRWACDGEDGPDTYEWDEGIAP